MRSERGKLSRHSDVAKAIDYMLKRWAAFTPVPRRRTDLLDEQCRGTSAARHCDGRVIVHPFFKCLETLEVCSRRQCDTGDLFGRLPP